MIDYRSIRGREQARMSVLSHDGFARQSFVRHTIPKRDRCSCAWCGSRPGRFAYGYEEDSLRNRAAVTARGFCSVSCFRAFDL